MQTVQHRKIMIIWWGLALLIGACNLPTYMAEPTLSVQKIGFRQKTATPIPEPTATIVPEPTQMPIILPTKIVVPSTEVSYVVDKWVGWDGELAPIWDASVSRWSAEIVEVSDECGLDPDLIAAVIRSESHGRPHDVSYAGAVGLMGIMSADVGFDWRPSEQKLLDPKTNIKWGCAILADIVRQSGGDLQSALAAYNGGWPLVNAKVTQGYASEVLNNYGRAVASRVGIDPNLAGRWTIAVEVSRGYISAESYILPEAPAQDAPLYGEHEIYRGHDQNGRFYHIVGYAVPLTMRGFSAENSPENNWSQR